MYIETERTPNPETLKFLPGQVVMPQGTAGFVSPEEAQISPLASALFALDGIEGVFFGRDFVSVTKASDSVEWANLKLAVLDILAQHFASGQLVMPTPPTAVAIEDDPEDAEIVDQINDLLDSRVRPQVAADGGDIIYRGFQRGVVYLQMQGACSGCPSSTATLKQGIEQLLRYYVPEVSEVRAVA